MRHIVKGQVNQASLKMKFDDQSPVGDLTKKSLRQVSAHRSRGLAWGIRAVGHAFAVKLKALPSHALQALPRTWFVEEKFRDSLKRTGAQMGKLLGALSAGNGHTIDAKEALMRFGKLYGAMGPMVRKGTETRQVFNARLYVNVRQMTTDQLRELGFGIQTAKMGGCGLDDYQTEIDHIAAVVDNELACRMEAHALEELRLFLAYAGSADGPPPDLAARYQQLLQNTEGAIANHDQQPARPGSRARSAGLAEEAPHAQARGLLMDALAYALAAKRRVPDPKVVKAIFRQLPTEELQHILTRGPTGRDGADLGREQVTAYARAELVRRRDAAAHLFIVGFNAMHERKRTSGSAITDGIVVLCKRLRAYKDIRDIPGAADAVGHKTVMDCEAALGFAFREKLLQDKPASERPKAGTKRPDSALVEGKPFLGQLKDDQLLELDRTLHDLDPERTSGHIQLCRRAVVEVIEKRIVALLMKKYPSDISQAFDALLASKNDSQYGDLPGAVLALARSDEYVARGYPLERAIRPHLAAATEEGARSALLQLAISRLEPDDRRQLAAELDKPQVIKLIQILNELTGFGYDPQQNQNQKPSEFSERWAKEQPEECRRLRRLAEDLAILRQEICGVGNPSPEGVQALTGLSAGVENALRALGVEVHERFVFVNSGAISEPRQKQVEANLRLLMTMTQDMDKRTGVPSALMNSLGQCGYTVRDENGNSRPLVDTHRWAFLSPEARFARRQAGLQAMWDLTKSDEMPQGNEKQWNALVRLATGNAMSDLVFGEIFLRDGRQGRLLSKGSSGTSTSIELGMDADGNIDVSFLKTIARADEMSIDGAGGPQVVPLMPGVAWQRSTLAIKITPQGEFVMVERARDEYEAELENAAFTPPEVSAHLFGPGASPAAVATLRSFLAKKEYTAEVFEFLDGVRQWRSDPNPTREAARALANVFVSQNAVAQNNLPNQVRLEIERRIRDWNSLDPEQKRGLFDAAEHEVQKLVWNDTRRRVPGFS